MKKITTAFVLLGAMLSARTVLAQEAKVELVGIGVGKKLTDAQKDAMFGSLEGTHLDILVSLPGRFIINADREACKFEKFSDDKGTELFASLGSAPRADDWMGSFGPRISPDGKICALHVGAPGLPVKEASKLSFVGSLILRCGVLPKSAEQKNVALKKSAKITAGPVPFEIVSTTTVGAEMKLELKAKQPLDRIISIKFFDAAGKEIKSNREGYSSTRFLGSYEITSSYALSRKVPVATVKVAYFDKVEPITVPIKVDAGLGF